MVVNDPPTAIETIYLSSLNQKAYVKHLPQVPTKVLLVINKQYVFSMDKNQLSHLREVQDTKNQRLSLREIKARRVLMQNPVSMESALLIPM